MAQSEVPLALWRIASPLSICLMEAQASRPSKNSTRANIIDGVGQPQPAQ